MPVTYEGVAQGNLIKLPEAVHLPDGVRVKVMVPQDDESLEDLHWTMLSMETWAKDWNNEVDAIYDNWRDIYGVKE